MCGFDYHILDKMDGKGEDNINMSFSLYMFISRAINFSIPSMCIIFFIITINAFHGKDREFVYLIFIIYVMVQYVN